jgi:two-component system chemotaxis response regulator CheB
MSSTAASRRSVRVLVIDDSAFMRTALSRMIASESGFEVVGTAASGMEGLDKIAALNPDIVTLDVQMPGIDGLATLRLIMHCFPRPVIMVSATAEKDAEITFNALSAGAFDYVPKQLSPTSLEIAHIRADLIHKIRSAAEQSESRRTYGPFPTPEILAIATSTGGPRALEQILPVFPRDLPIPILIVQHMPPGFTATFARRLDSLCAIQVCEASQRQLIEPGVAYLAPAGFHMRVQSRLSDLRNTIFLNALPNHALHIPSADIVMQSVAMVFGNRALGLILTGMGSDGAQGMKAIFEAGGLTIGQDEASCAVYGMPKACAELGILHLLLPLSEIPAQILQATRQRKPA